MRAHLTLELRRRDGVVLASRRGHNSVMAGGAQLLGSLFAGSGAAPINRMGVGTSSAPEPAGFDTAALTPGDLAGATEVPLTADAFIQVPPDSGNRVVRVRVRGTLPESAAVGTIAEAGLLARTDDATAVLYNRITFAPVRKADDHELTLFWEVTFPYGDLHWLP